MRKTFVAIAGALTLTSVVIGVAGAAKPKTFHFTDKIVGGQISATQAVFKVHDSRLGQGAGVQTVKLNGLTGTDTETTYYGNASAHSHGSFTLGPPDSNGVSRLRGKGRDTGGTGRLRGFKSTYTYTGTFNTKSFVFKLVLTGTGSTQ